MWSSFSHAFGVSYSSKCLRHWIFIVAYYVGKYVYTTSLRVTAEWVTCWETPLMDWASFGGNFLTSK